VIYYFSFHKVRTNAVSKHLLLSVKQLTTTYFSRKVLLNTFLLYVFHSQIYGNAQGVAEKAVVEHDNISEESDTGAKPDRIVTGNQEIELTQVGADVLKNGLSIK
jgi:hypothetical protein